MNVYKVNNFYIVHPVLKKAFQYSLEREYLNLPSGVIMLLYLQNMMF